MRLSPARTVVGALTSALVLLVWGGLFWGVLYKPAGVYNTLPGDVAVATALMDAGTQTGTYFYPWPRDTPEAMEAFLEKHRSGPFFKLSYVAEGVDPQSPRKMLLGALHHLLVCSLAAGLLWLAAAPRVRDRAAIVFLAGSIGTVYIQVADPIWYHLPWDYPRGVLIYELVSWALMAGVLAVVMRPPAVTLVATGGQP